MNERSMAAIRCWETRRGERPPKGREAFLQVSLPDRHYLDAIRAEAKVRNMTVNAFIRAMIRGYFGAALHGR